MRVTWLGHATVVIEADQHVIITDPLIGVRVAHLRRRTAPPPAHLLRQVDTVLVSHVHMDHLHRPSLRRFGASDVIAPVGSRRLIPGTTGEITEVRAGDRVVVAGAASEVSIEVVHAEHLAGRGPHSRVVAEPVGYIVRSQGTSVYFAGDTDLFPEMGAFGRIDVALLPIWGWGSTLGERHLDPNTAAEAVGLLGAAHVIPIHWGTYSPVRLGTGAPRWLRNPLADFREALAQHGHTSALVALEPGESFVVPRASHVSDRSGPGDEGSSPFSDGS